MPQTGARDAPGEVHDQIRSAGGVLPAIAPRCFVRRGDAGIEEAQLRLDTVAIDADAGELVLLWRGLVEVASREYEEIDAALLVVVSLFCCCGSWIHI